MKAILFTAALCLMATASAANAYEWGSSDRIDRRQERQEFRKVAGQALPEPAAAVVAELSDREVEVLRLVAQGLSNREIAESLSLSEHTVKSHLANILDKLHLRSRAHAAAYAVQAGLVRDVQAGR
jgi:DNA-binding NarL/FixJ family response regulator